MLPENVFIFTKEDAKTLKTSQLYGYGLTENAVIFGTQGLSAYKAKGHGDFPAEGRFSGIFIENENNIRIRTDTTGQDLIYLYRDGDDWAVSNSFLLLAETMKRTRKLTLYKPGLMGFHLKDGIHVGEQLVSHRTAIEEISLLPLTSELHVNRHTGACTISSGSYLDVFAMGKDGKYEDVFLDTIERSAGFLAALRGAGFPMKLFLSGGYDSRLVLFLNLAGGPLEKDFRVISYEFKADDFKVASSLCQKLNVPLNVGGPAGRKTLSASDAIRMYFLSSGGTYLPFYQNHAYYVHDNAELRLTGDHPTGWTFFDGSAKFNGDALKLAKDMETALEPRGYGHQIREEFMSNFELLGIEAKHPASMLACYNAIRSRHHCGRGWSRSQGTEYLFTPLMQSSFVSLDMRNAENGFHPTKFFADAFSALGGLALSEPFERPDRALKPDYLENSPFKGGATITPRKYEVFGSIGHSSYGPPDLFSLEIESDLNNDQVKQQLQMMFHRAARARASELFTENDLVLAKSEIEENGKLSHRYRKLCHFVVADTILKIVEESGHRTSEPGRSGNHGSTQMQRAALVSA